MFIRFGFRTLCGLPSYNFFHNENKMLTVLLAFLKENISDGLASCGISIVSILTLMLLMSFKKMLWLKILIGEMMSIALVGK